MRFKELTMGDKKITNQQKIDDVLEQQDFDWLLYSEIENADIEIKNKTLIWKGGDFYSGRWHYGIFKAGNFYGTFESGIFEGGNFKGKFIGGLKK